MTTTLPHPSKTIITAAEMQARIDSGDGLALRKYDGELCQQTVAGATILCERMRGEISGHLYNANDRAMFITYGEWFAALTVESIEGENILDFGARMRYGVWAELLPKFPPNMVLAETVTDVAATMASGAEGVMWTDWSATWGRFLCHKAASIYICRIAENPGGKQSVAIVDAETGVDRGRITLRGGKIDRVQRGDLIRCEAVGEHDGKKLRQANPCRQWLKRGENFVE